MEKLQWATDCLWQLCIDYVEIWSATDILYDDYGSTTVVLLSSMMTMVALQ